MTDGISFDEWNAKLAGPHAVAPDIDFGAGPEPDGRVLMRWIAGRTSFHEMSRGTGIPVARLLQIANGARLRREDAIKLARHFDVSLQEFAKGPSA